jgi:hypothetical protein
LRKARVEQGACQGHSGFWLGCTPDEATRWARSTIKRQRTAARGGERNAELTYAEYRCMTMR